MSKTFSDYKFAGSILMLNREAQIDLFKELLSKGKIAKKQFDFLATFPDVTNPALLKTKREMLEEVIKLGRIKTKFDLRIISAESPRKSTLEYIPVSRRNPIYDQELSAQLTY